VAAGTARQNTCTANESAGIYVGEQAHPILEANICQNNKTDGISYWNEAAGIARNNQCLNNGEDGIYADPTTKPQLKDNICSGNASKNVNDQRRNP
jgi:parallel beta-helix repeat protein